MHDVVDQSVAIRVLCCDFVDHSGVGVIAIDRGQHAIAVGIRCSRGARRIGVVAIRPDQFAVLVFVALGFGGIVAPGVRRAPQPLPMRRAQLPWDD